MEIRSTTLPETDERPRILVVESNKTNLAVIARRLVDAGYRVSAADSGPAAVAELHRAPIDLVLAELNMRQINGAELARLIRDEIVWRDLPVMLITGKSKAADAVSAYAAGADDVILKPFHFEVLFARIDRRIERARSLKRLRHDNATLDARVVERAIQVGELRDRLARLEATVGSALAVNPPRSGRNSGSRGLSDPHPRARAPSPGWR
ncbi:MAG: response regulator [Sphingomicrobium sp.]